MHRRTPIDESLTLKFILPIALENILTISIGLVFSQLISTISASALAATGMANAVMNVLSSAYHLLYTGGAVLVSRQIGARDYDGAKETTEQTIFLGAVSSTILMLACMLGASGIMHILMPTAEQVLFRESVRYFRIQLLSLPFWMLQMILSNVSRASGNSRAPMYAVTIMNLAQIAFAWLFIRILGMEEIGAGLAYVCCRFVGATLLFFAVIKDKRYYVLKIRNMLRPKTATCRRILNIGAPLFMESVFVQIGYMIANSMSIAIGTFESGVYQIINTLNSFTSLPQTITLTLCVSAVGHILGSGRVKEAKRVGRCIWAIAEGATICLCLILVIFGRQFSSLYSSDPAAIDLSAKLMWVLIPMGIGAVSINSIDPQLKAGGDVKFVMVMTLSAIWCIRLPLTWLFCFKLHWGVLGIFMANTISHWVRAICGLIRHSGERWIKLKV